MDTDEGVQEAPMKSPYIITKRDVVSTFLFLFILGMFTVLIFIPIHEQSQVICGKAYNASILLPKATIGTQISMPNVNSTVTIK